MRTQSAPHLWLLLVAWCKRGVLWCGLLLRRLHRGLLLLSGVCVVLQPVQRLCDGRRMRGMRDWHL